MRLAITFAGVGHGPSRKRLTGSGLGGDATCKFLGGSWEDRRDVYQSASPAALLPLGVPQVLVHGLDDSVVPPSMSENYQAKAVQRGDVGALSPSSEGVGHRDVTDPFRARGGLPPCPSWRTSSTETRHLGHSALVTVLRYQSAHESPAVRRSGVRASLRMRRFAIDFSPRPGRGSRSNLLEASSARCRCGAFSTTG